MLARLEDVGVGRARSLLFQLEIVTINLGLEGVAFPRVIIPFPKCNATMSMHFSPATRGRVLLISPSNFLSPASVSFHQCPQTIALSPLLLSIFFLREAEERREMEFQ